MFFPMFKTIFGSRRKNAAAKAKSLNESSVEAKPGSSFRLPAGRRLHIGGHTVQPDWEIFDAQRRAGVDHVGNADDLSRFPSETFAAVYASHVLEHFEYFRVISVLREWSRVLVPEGLLYVSVPDLDTLSAIMLDKSESTLQQRFDAVRMLFGGQTDSWDYHKVGLNEEMLLNFFRQAGFRRAQRVSDFGFFPDTSTLMFLKRPISLNLIASKSM